MAAEQSMQDGDATRRVGELPEASGPRRTPDESTAGLASALATAPAVSSSESDVPLLQPGETLVGRFTVVCFIAHGGMGAVYEANDSVLRTRVALKLIRRRIAQDSTAMERFRREVLLARQVSHPNVCRVYELYEATTASGEPIQFLTMELLLGETLSRRLARDGTLSTAEAFPLVQQMCAGLAAAHAEGVIHRDFKSGNVMLVPRAEPSGQFSTETRVAITDFGVARALSTSAAEDRLTGEAGLLGTPEYMAPEQVTGSEVTPATDIYALGVVLYEMVTGKLPFVGDTPLAAAARRLNEAAPRPELLAPGLDARWARAILRCLAREPRRRFRSALDVVEALSGPPRRWRRPLVLAALASVSLLLGVFAAVWPLPRLQRGRTRPVAAVAIRPVAAILGFANGLPSKGLPWLPTAVEEGLHRELAAAETSLRLLPTDRAANVRRSLGVTEDELSNAKARSRMQGLLVANTLIHGDIAPAEGGSEAVQVRLHVLEGPTGKELASFAEELGPDATRLPEALVKLGGSLRDALHASLTSEEEAALASTRLKGVDAAQAYAEGLLSLRAFDYPRARDYFDAALAHDQNLVDAQLRIAESWLRQGFRKKAREATERLASRGHLLTPGQAAEIGAQVKGGEARLALFNTRPDDEELGFAVALVGASPMTQLALVRRLRQLPPPISEDVRLDLAEAKAASWSGDHTRGFALLDVAERRATELGARSERAMAQKMRGNFLSVTPGTPPQQAVPPLREALLHYSEIGDLESVARMMSELANQLDEYAPRREVLTAFDEAASLSRRLGNRLRLHDLLVRSAVLRWHMGDAGLARKRLEEARSDVELLSEPPGDNYLWVRARFLCTNAEQGCETAMQEWRARVGSDDPAVLMVEADQLRNRDHLEEARVQWKRAAVLAEQVGQRGLSAWARSEACEVECEQGHPAEGLACLAAIALTAAGREEAVVKGRSEAQCRYLSRDFSGAETAARRALESVPTGDFVWHAMVVTEVDRAMAGRGQTARAISELKKKLGEIEVKQSYQLLAFEVALALGEAELAAGVAAGRPRLLRLEQEAKAKESFRVARRAREALDRHRPEERVVRSSAP
jgi:tRNA A-37 threonylcarbamoyl transferase component Bud32